MDNILRKASSIGLVLVLMATIFVSFPVVSAPPDKCEPWPECKDGEEPQADPEIVFYVQTPQARHPNRIMVMNADGSNQAVIYEEFFVLNGLSWSPDGSSLAWSGHLETGPTWEYGIWRIDVEIADGEPQGTNLLQLVSHADCEICFSAAWSPLGDEIAYVIHTYDGEIDEFGINAIPATGGTPYNIHTAPDGYGLTHGLAWSSDGTQLAAIGGELPAGYDGMGIEIIDRETGTVTHRLLTGQFRFQGLDWARQSSNTVLFHDSGGSGLIYTVDIDSGTANPVVEGCCASWSPDNSKVVYLQPGNRPDRRIISIYDLSTEEITELRQGGSRPDWRRF